MANERPKLAGKVLVITGDKGQSKPDILGPRLDPGENRPCPCMLAISKRRKEEGRK
jgi:hypothetical protein